MVKIVTVDFVCWFIAFRASLLGGTKQFYLQSTNNLKN